MHNVILLFNDSFRQYQKKATETQREGIQAKEEQESESFYSREFKEKTWTHERQLLSLNSFNKAVQFNFRSVGSCIMKSIVKKG